MILPSAILWSKLTKRVGVAIVLISTTFILWVSLLRFRAPVHELAKPLPPPPEPRYELFGIGGFKAGVEVTTLDIRANEVDEASLPLNQQLSIALPSFSYFHLDNPKYNQSNPIEHHVLNTAVRETVQVNVAKQGSQPDASHLTIGVATSLSRLPEALLNFKHWAAHTNVHFVIIVELPDREKHPKEPSIAEAKDMYAKAGIPNLTLVESAKDFLERYVELIGVLHDHVEPNKTKWVSFIDDDTFFFRMETLLARLEKYDPDRSFYVGQTSENKWNVDDGGIFAIGGAGVFMTVPLLRQLAAHREECESYLPGGAGDVRLAHCIFTYTTTKVSLEYGLYQLDLHIDVTGFYEAVRPQPISVHHWKTWHHHDMPTVSAVSSVCGQACVLQHFKFRDGWQMTNGFSIIKYSYNETELASQIEAAMEHTWKLTIWDIPTSWLYSLAPLKPKDEGKIQYMMEKVDYDQDQVILYYVRRRNGAGEGLIRVAWSES